MHKSRFVVIAAIVIASAAVYCRDFPEPFPALDPLYGSAPAGAFIPDGHAEFAYVSHTFAASSADTFDVRSLVSFPLVRVGDAFALGMRWGAYILVGPIGPGETAATVAEWWMNAAQYEYGLSAAFGFFRTHLILEYSRTSQHPWRSAYSQVTTDAIKSGIALPTIQSGRATVDVRFVGGYVDLFDFWKSSVPKPRTSWVLSPAARVSYRLRNALSLFGKFEADGLFLRSEGTDADFWGELGLEIGGARPRLELYLDGFFSNDTEELADGPSRAALLGYGMRLSF